MAVKKVTMYTIECDICGAISGDGEEICAWTDSLSAYEVAYASGWNKIDDRDYCPDCSRQYDKLPRHTFNVKISKLSK